MTDRRDSKLLDDFVDAFVNLDDLICFHEEPPPELLFDCIDPDDWNVLRWKPAKLATQRNGIESLRCAGPLPTLFEQLALWYAWLDIDLGICRFFANPPTPGVDWLTNSMFGDPVMNKTLLPSRLVRFALAPDCCYDPICFDLSRFDGHDCPIIRFEHESILRNDRLGHREVLFESFRELVHAIIDDGRTKSQTRDRTKR
jgi:hypothetical protein